MPKPTALKRVLFTRTPWASWVGVFLAVFVSVLLPLLNRQSQPVQAATSSTLNFQARLLNAAGNVVPDGFYNIEFKLYNVDAGGSVLWTETYYDSNGGTAGNDNRLRVKNGYFSVNLGSLDSLADESINWDQELWLTMNIGGSTQTATPTWDGEMSPRIKLTAVPYAFRAGQLATLQGGNTSTLSFDTQTGARSILLPDASGTVCLQSSSACGFATGSGSAFLQGGNSFGATAVLGTDDSNNLEFETGGTTRLTIDTSGSATLTGNLTVQGTGTSSFAGNIDVAKNIAIGSSATVVTPWKLNVNHTFDTNDDCLFGCVGTSIGVTATNPANTAGLGLRGLYVSTSTGAASFTLANNYGIYLDSGSAGSGSTITNNYGVYVNLQSKGTNDYGVYIEGADTYALLVNSGVSRFNGNLELNGTTITPIQNQNFALGNAQQITFTSDLSGGARSASALSITQANNASNNNTAALLAITNSDTASTGAGLSVTQSSTTTANAITVTTSSTTAAVTVGTPAGGTGVAVTGSTSGTAFNANSITSGTAFSAISVSSGTGLSLSSLSTGTGISYGNVTTGNVISGSIASISSGGIINATNSTSGALSAFTGKYLNFSPTRTLTSGSINDSGNFIYLNRNNTNNGIGTLTVSGDMAVLQSTCGGTGTCTDTANILELNQQYASASGAVLNVLGAGTGNLATLDATNTSANGVSIDVQSSSSSQYALDVRSNNGTSRLYVRADGNVGIGTASPAELLHLSSSTDADIRLEVASNSDNPSIFFRAAAGSIGSEVILSNGSIAGGFNFSGYDGSTHRSLANIRVEVDGTPGASDMPGRIVFETTPDGSVTPQERLRISQSGNVGIGDTDPAYLLTVGSGDLFGVNSSGNVIVTALGAADTSTIICRNSSNQLASCSGTIGSTTLQQAYDNDADGSDAIIALNATDGGFLVRDHSTPLSTAFAIQDSAGTGNYLSVASTGINIGLDVTVAAQKTIRLIGGTTAQRPGSPTEGMLYFDTDTDQLLTYANGKWQATTGEYTIVAASNSSQAIKDAAHYVADGNGGGAGDGDQVQINAALTAASGGKVYLAAGTYVADGTILIPNNTTLAGAGRGTLIELADLDASDNLIENSDTTTGTGVTIQDLRLDGRDDLNTVGVQYGIYLNGMGGGSGASARQGAKVTNLFVNNFRSSGIFLSSSYNSTLSTITSQGNEEGFRVISGDNNIFIGNIAQGNAYGFNFWGDHNTFVGNLAQGNSYGFFLDNGADHNTLTGNTVQGNSGYGIYLFTATNNTLSGNKIHDNGGATTNNGIFLSEADNNTITGHNITDTSCTTNCYAINISDSPSGANYLANNQLGSGTINDAGTGTVYGGQLNGSGNYVIEAQAGTIELQSNTNITGNADISGSLNVGANNELQVSNSGNISIRQSGDTNPRVAINNDASIEFGPGNGAHDLEIFRSSSSVLGIYEAGSGKTLKMSTSGNATWWWLDHNDIGVGLRHGFGTQEFYLHQNGSTILQGPTSGGSTVFQVNGTSTGNLAVLDASHTSANGLSVDIQSSSSSQYALRVTTNNGANVAFEVKGDGSISASSLTSCEGIKSNSAGTLSCAYGAITKVSKIEFTGHSQTYGYGATDPSLRWSTKLARLLGATEVNRGINGANFMGTGVANGGWVNVVQNVIPKRTSAPYLTSTNMATIQLGQNDLPWTDGGNTNQIKHALRTIVSRYRAAAVFEAEAATGSGITYSGTWSTQSATANSGTGYKQSSTNGDTYTIAVPADFPGGTVTVGLIGVTGGNGAVHTYTVDGGGAGNLDTRSVVTAGAGGLSIRFTGLSAGAHTIVGTLSSVTGSTGVDYWQIEAQQAPLVAVLNAARILDYSAYGGSVNDTDVTDLNTAMQEVVNEFDSSVVYVDVDTAINKTTTYFHPDNAHFNDRGNAVIAGTVYRAIANAPVSAEQLAYTGGVPYTEDRQVIRNTNDTTAALSVQTASGNNVLHVDTSLQTVNIGRIGIPQNPYGTTSTTGGSLTAATYTYKITARNATQESAPTANVAVTTTGSTSTVTLTWDPVPGATEYRVYLTNTSGYFTTTTNSYTHTSGAGTVCSFNTLGCALDDSIANKLYVRGTAGQSSQLLVEAVTNNSVQLTVGRSEIGGSYNNAWAWMMPASSKSLQLFNLSTFGTPMVIQDDDDIVFGQTASAARFIEIDSNSGADSFIQSSNGTTLVQNNLYFNGSAWVYDQNGRGTALMQFDGGFTFYRAASGTAGNTATLTETMVLTNAGNVGIGDSSPDARLDVEPTGAVTATSYAQRIENLQTNVTTDAIDKYGLHITSTGSFTGSAGTATNNYGLFVATPSGADNNYAAVFQSGNVGVGDTTPDFKFEVQTTAGNGYFAITNSSDGDILQVTATGELKIGTTAAVGLSGAKLLVTSAEVTTALRVGDGTNGISFNDQVSGKLRYRGTARNDVTVALRPEFEGATFRADGGSNVGILNSGFCSNEGSLSINTGVCGVNTDHSYYEWNHSEASAQDYDIIVRYRMPSDFDSGTFDDAGSISIYGWRTDATTNSVQATMYNDAGAVCGTASQEAAGTAATWNTLSFAGLSGDTDCGDIGAGEYVTFVFHLTADTSDTVRLGEIEITYKSIF